MEDRLRKLKKSMTETVFNGLTFTELHKNKVKNKAAKLNLKSDDELVLVILQLLTQEKTGFQLNQSIRARGIENFDHNEGKLYMVLHRLEQKGYLQACWEEADKKYYQVTDKGSKLLTLAEKKRMSTKSILKGILEG